MLTLVRDGKVVPIDRKWTRWTEQQKDEFRRAWNNGIPGAQLAELMNTSVINIYGWARKIPGCNQRPRGRAKGAKNGPRLSAITQTRHAARDMAPDGVVPLTPDSAAIKRGGTVYPSTVIDARRTQRILVSGHNNRKIGRRIEKGAWSGCPIFVVTLEERATCPRSCYVWATCYGNNMHMARRHAHGPLFERRLELELKIAAIENPNGFVVRLHVLGDFYSVDYVRFWARMLTELPELRVWGYTACDASSQDAGEAAIARDIQKVRWSSDRFCIRWSRRGPIPGGSTVINYVPEAARVPEGLVCPAQMHATQCCATCGLCWSPSARSETIVFVAHGRLPKESFGSVVTAEESDESGDRGVEVSGRGSADTDQAGKPDLGAVAQPRPTAAAE